MVANLFKFLKSVINKRFIKQTALQQIIGRVEINILCLYLVVCVINA